MMRRREFIALLGGVAAWPLAARAQQKVPLIGLLLVRGPEPMGPFREALRDLGYLEGKTIQIEKRSAEGHEDRLPERPRLLRPCALFATGRGPKEVAPTSGAM
jgi:putative ABC transport system substrate-binding protein